MEMNVSNMYIFHVVRFFKKVKNLYIDQSFITSENTTWRSQSNPV